MIAEYDPSPAEIAEATSEIRRSWTPEEFDRRRTRIMDPLLVQGLHRCETCGNVVSNPCVYCASKSARQHSPTEFLATRSTDRVGYSDASNAFNKSVADRVDLTADNRPAGGGDFVSDHLFDYGIRRR
jgi:hypothetical protein